VDTSSLYRITLIKVSVFIKPQQVHPLTGEGDDVASHHIVVENGQGGKEQVTALALDVKLPCSAMSML
jgi:hypothetical protein